MAMVKKYYDFKFELDIDGQPYPPEKAAPLFQCDPFPGGHQYSCVITCERLGKYFDLIPFERNGSVSEKVARSFFLSLGLSWNPAAEEDVSLEYFLNTVDEIDFDGERLVFWGICSAVVRD